MKLSKRFLFVLLILSICFTTYSLTDQKNLEKSLNSITPHDAYDYCKTMALPKYAGRHTGHPGYTEAAKWAASKFQQWGLKPINKKDGYLQPYRSPYVIVESAEMELFLPKEKSSDGEKEYNLKKLELEKDFLPMFSSDSGDNRAGLVFAGWGISAPELGYDDYAGLDVKGKFVLCFRGVPDRSDERFQEHDHHRQRLQTAKDKGALGLFYIYPNPLGNPNADWIQDFTPALISYAVADMLLEEKGIKSEELREDLQTYQVPIRFNLGSEIHFKVKAEHFPDAIGYNVAGYVEGSDPDLKDECLIIGGHFDHCGLHCGLLFPGANDNASGSAVVMEIGEAFSRLETAPKRSVVFVLFGGEEMGLQGSSFFADNPPAQFQKMDGMFNFDMVGEGDGVGCGVSSEPEELASMLKDADQKVNILRGTRFFRGVGVRGSDYASFFVKGVPCISFASNGPHLHYHGTGDTIYRINPDIMADIAKLAFITGYNWADR